MRGICGACYWLIDHFERITTRYQARCAQRNRPCTEGDLRRCFSPPRFQLGNLNPSWAKYVAAVPSLLGKNWRNRLENLLFDLNDDVPLMYRYEDNTGPLVDKFLREFHFSFDVVNFCSF